ncbi:MAG TPA: DUF3891 family protein [Ktedonobacteraceae bacterium]|nr:DUF3891 family protein [Ktedonobacteraceae bacterium]
MLYRENTQGRIAITQPTHAWVSGQLARAWGNGLFGDVTPWEEVCLGAEQHDVGHTTWEQAPILNPQTGLPYAFFEMPRQMHLHIWSIAARLILPLGRYPALLVSLHGTGLYETFYDATKETPENAQAVQNYLSQEYAFQQKLLTALRADPYYAPYATEEAVARNQRLIKVWDAFSLAICYGRSQMNPLQLVPTATGTTTLTLSARDGDPTQLIVSPWPFRRQQVTLVYEGRYLPETFSDQTLMREALQIAPRVTLQTTLFPD